MAELPVPAPVPEGWPVGLTDEEAAERARSGRANVESIRGSVSVARILRRNVLTILNGSLASVSVLLLLLGLGGDALVTCAPVAINVVVGVIGELDAKRRLDRITLAARAPVTLVRDGRERRVMPDLIVEGDAVILERGDRAVVDGRLVAGSIEADESILTGESEPVARRPGDAIRSGTICLAGRGAMTVTNVGAATFASRLAAEARRASDERTPLRRDLNALVLALGILAIVTAIPVGLALRADGVDLFSPEAAQVAAVLVAMIPQGLLVMMTVTYGYAALRISRAGAIVQRIDAVEAMARVDTLCLDKTGTITADRLDLAALHVVDEGSSEDRLRQSLANLAASATSRNRTIDAIAAALPGARRELFAEIPFSSARRWSAAVLAEDAGRAWYLGAPEAFGIEPGGAVVVMDGSAAPTPSAPGGPGAPLRSTALIVAAVEGEVAAGRRCLVLGTGSATALADPGDTQTRGDVPAAVRPVAVIGLAEQVRRDAPATLDQLRAAGLELKLISGDAPLTVLGVAERAAIPVAGSLSGDEVEALDDRALRGAATASTVFGRIGPEAKRRLVRALKGEDRYVAMTGDGVNDVLAMREAHLAVAMESGSPAARAVAGLVLLGDRFAVLPRAIVEGQRVVAAMIAVASVLVARTISIMLIVAASAVLDLPFPFTPKLNAVLALVTVGIPTMVLVLWVPPMRSPRRVAWTMVGYAVPAGLAVAILAVPLMIDAFGRLPVGQARIATTTLSVLAGIGLLPILFPAERDRAGPFGRGGDLRPTLLAGAMLLLFILVSLVPVSREFFELGPLDTPTIALLAGCTAAWMGGLILLLRLGWPQRVVGALLRAVERSRAGPRPAG
jgi:cation-transporting ATPase E